MTYSEQKFNSDRGIDKVLEQSPEFQQKSRDDELRSKDKIKILKIKEAIKMEKEDLKQIRLQLEEERQKWKRDSKIFKDDPSKKAELISVKRIIDQNV